MGEYRLAPINKPQLKDLEPVRVEFNSAFQGEQVRDLLGNQVKYVVESNTWSMFLINVLPFAIVLLLIISAVLNNTFHFLDFVTIESMNRDSFSVCTNAY